MMYRVHVGVLPHEPILDPQGKATEQGLHQLGFAAVTGVRVGKWIRLDIEAANEAEARAKAQQAAEALLINPITEYYTLAQVAPLG